jgi:esterase/lipase superfamily enzyme
MKDEPLIGGKRHDFILQDKKLRMRKDEFLSQLFRGKEKRDILLYVHGYNTTFDESALTVEQIASDLDFRGNALFYSWPSAGRMFGYVRDQNNTDWSRKHLTSFLRELADRSGRKSLCLIAHGMGNRELPGFLLDLLHDKPDYKEKIRVIVLAAPDVDSEIFCRDIAPFFADEQILVTMYVSRRDKALKASKDVDGYVRAGDVDGEPIVVAGIDTVDVTNIDTIPLGHSYNAYSRHVLADIHSIISEGLNPESRVSPAPVEFMKGDKKKIYWIFVKQGGGYSIFTIIFLK